MQKTQITHSERAVLARMWGYLKPHGRLLIVGIICAMGTSLVAAGVTEIASQLSDFLKSPKMHLLLLICGEIILVYCLKWISSVGQAISFSEVGQRVGMRIKNDIYSHLQSLSLSYFDRQRTGNLMSTLSNDVPVLQNGIMAIKDAISGPIIAFGGFILMCVISWKLSLVTVALLPILYFAIRGISHKLRAISAETQDRLADISVLTEETLAGVRLVRSFATEQREIARFHAQTEAAKKIFMEGARRAAVLSPTTDLIGACGIAIALFVGGGLVISGQMLSHDLTRFVVLINFVRNGADSIGSLWVNVRQTQGAVERIFTNVLDVPTEVTELPYAKPLVLTSGEVRFENVEFAYQASRPVLRDISFTMVPGHVTAVVGPSGAGKSTLADLIPRFYDPTAGAILIDGGNIRGVQIESLRRQIGIVPQETILFNMSVRDNIAYGRPGASDDEVAAAARHANAHDFITRWPNGYETIVGDRGVQLSGGERQRVAIARALLSDPKILILDEATSSLDSTSETQVQLALDTLMKGRTTLVIAHRLSTIVNADNILVLEAGSIVESGTHGELLRRNGAYARLYKNQFRGRDTISDTPPGAVLVPTKLA